jgi:hypothetical protein
MAVATIFQIGILRHILNRHPKAYENGYNILGHCYCTICTLIKGKVEGKQIGVTLGYPITVTSIGFLFLFRVVGPGETSPVTWGFEKAKSK